MSALDYRKFAAIMTWARSGSNMLGSFLDSHPNLSFAGPVFGVRTGYRGQCNEFRETKEEMERCLNALLLDFQKKNSSLKILILDIKHPWITPHVENFMKQIKVIHLIRRDLKRRYFSAMFWEAVKKDPYLLATGRERLRFHIDAKTLKRDIAKVEAHRKQFAYLADLELSYEGITGNKHVSELPERVNTKICEFLEISDFPMTTQVVKLSPPVIEGLLK